MLQGLPSSLHSGLSGPHVAHVPRQSLPRNTIPGPTLLGSLSDWLKASFGAGDDARSPTCLQLA